MLCSSCIKIIARLPATIILRLVTLAISGIILVTTVFKLQSLTRQQLRSLSTDGDSRSSAVMGYHLSGEVRMEVTTRSTTISTFIMKERLLSLLQYAGCLSGTSSSGGKADCIALRIVLVDPPADLSIVSPLFRSYYFPRSRELVPYYSRDPKNKRILCSSKEVRRQFLLFYLFCRQFPLSLLSVYKTVFFTVLFFGSLSEFRFVVQYRTVQNSAE